MFFHISHFLLRYISIITIRSLAWESELKIRGLQLTIRKRSEDMVFSIC
jgi:hypothetical protein